jgi:SAM-dependent methyltransferase
MFHVEQFKSETLRNCPACSYSQSSFLIKCRDYTVSQLEFDLTKCLQCGLIYTNPRPTIESIGKFYESAEYISHSNSKKGLINQLYQFIRRFSIRKKLKLINSFHHSIKTLLDIGCGTGEFLNFAALKGWNTTGVEPSEKAKTFAQTNYRLKIENERWLEQTTELFSVITMWHVLEHVHELKKRIDQLNRLLSENGVVIIAVPNIDSYDKEYYKQFWASYDVPRHLYHFSPAVIKKLFSDHGFSHVKSLPMKFDSYYVSMLSEKYKSGSNNLIKAFLTGWRSNRKAKGEPEKYSSVIYIFKKTTSSS